MIRKLNKQINPGEAIQKLEQAEMKKLQFYDPAKL